MRLRDELLGPQLPSATGDRNIWGRYCGPWAMTYVYVPKATDGAARLGVQLDEWTPDGKSVSAGLHVGLAGRGFVVGWKPVAWHKLAGRGKVLLGNRIALGVGVQGEGAPIVDGGRMTHTRDDGATLTCHGFVVRLPRSAGPALSVGFPLAGPRLASSLAPWRIARRRPRFLFAARLRPSDRRVKLTYQDALAQRFDACPTDDSPPPPHDVKLCRDLSLICQCRCVPCVATGCPGGE